MCSDVHSITLIIQASSNRSRDSSARFHKQACFSQWKISAVGLEQNSLDMADKRIFLSV